MISSPTTTRQTVPDFTMEWPGSHRWAVLVDQLREHFYGIEEWLEVKRVGSGELGISPAPKLPAMNDYSRPREPEERWVGVGFASGWTLLAS